MNNSNKPSTKIEHMLPIFSSRLRIDDQRCVNSISHLAKQKRKRVILSKMKLIKSIPNLTSQFWCCFVIIKSTNKLNLLKYNKLYSETIWHACQMWKTHGIIDSHENYPRSKRVELTINCPFRHCHTPLKFYHVSLSHIAWIQFLRLHVLWRRGISGIQTRTLCPPPSLSLKLYSTFSIWAREFITFVGTQVIC